MKLLPRLTTKLHKSVGSRSLANCLEGKAFRSVFPQSIRLFSWGKPFNDATPAIANTWSVQPLLPAIIASTKETFNENS